MLGLDIRDTNDANANSAASAYSYFQQFTAALDESIEEFQFVLQITLLSERRKKESERRRGEEIKQAD